ncbi:hypothetical protein HDU76_008533 [Blyttiomyces sp. JEL0837]|nr:hypothetical protein HDU76_008533 [Blyttiomyces sp. JEL0837]
MAGESDQVMVIAGYGPGIGNAVAKKFAKLGYKLALLSSNEKELQSCLDEFAKENITCKAYQVDLSDPTACKQAMNQVREALGPITILFWNAIKPPKPLLDPSVSFKDLDAGYRVAVTSLAVAIKACMDDLKKTKGCVVCTGDGLALENEEIVKMTVKHDLDSLAIDKAQQRKAVQLMHERMKPEGIFVGEVTVTSAVKGTPLDVEGKGKLTSETVADNVYEMVKKKEKAFCHVAE